MDGKNTLLPGTMLRQYRLEKVIGQGGFGITYLAFDSELHRSVAIKECFPRDFVSREGTTVVPTGADTKVDYDWAVDKFIAEATTLAKFRHPGIVQVLQILKGENNSAYMVLEYVEGQSLDQWLKSLSGPPSQRQLEAIIAPMLDALAAVHKANFIHRDIAPDNIFIRKTGEAVLLDFGAAKLTVAQHSQTVHQIVKSGYSAPEQYYAEGRQGPWTDIYAFSATLYRCLSGRKPVDAAARQGAINNDEPDPLEPLEALGLEGYSPVFLAAIMAGLSPRSKDRPQDVASWRGQLLSGDGAASGGDATALVKEVGEIAAVRPGAVSRPLGKSARSGGSTSQRTGGGGRLPRLVAALVILVALAGAGFWFFDRQNRIAEAEAWAAAQESDSAKGYGRFAQDYPDSRFADELQAAVARLADPWEFKSGDGATGIAHAVVAMEEGLVVAGEQFGAGAVGAQGVLHAFSLSGKVRWTATFGESGNESFNGLIALPGGDLVVAGQSIGAKGGASQGIVARFSASGEEVWSRRFGGPGMDRLTAVQRLPNGDLIAVGASSRISGSRSQGWVLLLSPRGELISERTLDAANGGIFRAVAATPGGGYVLAGNSGEDDPEGAQFWVVKISSDGGVLFDRSFGGQNMDRINALAAGADGDFVMAGQTRSFGTRTDDGIALRLTADNKMPPKPFVRPGEDVLTAIAVRTDGTVVIAGHTSSPPADTLSAWILRLSQDMRTVQGEDILGGEGEIHVGALAVLGDGSLVIVGSIAEEKGGDGRLWLRRVP